MSIFSGRHRIWSGLSLGHYLEAFRFTSYNLLHDFTKHLLHDFTISSTILQFPPRFYNFLHDFTISSTILQFPPRFYNFLHEFAISSTMLQFAL